MHYCRHIRCICPTGRVKRPAGSLARPAQAQRCFDCLGARALTLAPGLMPTTAFAETQARLPEVTKRIPGTDTSIRARLLTVYTLNEHLSFQDIHVDSRGDQRHQGAAQ